MKKMTSGFSVATRWVIFAIGHSFGSAQFWICDVVTRQPTSPKAAIRSIFDGRLAGTEIAPTLAEVSPEGRLATQARSEAKAGPVVAPGERMVMVPWLLLPSWRVFLTFGQVSPLGTTARA